MSRTPCPPTVYLAAWDDQRIVKAGFTARRRWRDWELRGARLVVLQEYSTCSLALDVETEMYDALQERGRLAFGSEAESRVLLGRCGGWRETFRVDADPHAFPHALAVLIRIAAEHAELDADPHCRSAYACAYPGTTSDPSVKPQVNAEWMRNRCGIDASASCGPGGKPAGQTPCYADAYASADASRARRTNERYGRTDLLPRDPSLTLINARVRVRPGDRR